MKNLNLINLILITLLSFASGIPKIMRMPQEVEFFGAAGLSNPLLVGFGALHVIGGLLLALPRTRKWGALLMAILFSASALMIFMSGNVPFGLFSLLPVALAGLIFTQTASTP